MAMAQKKKARGFNKFLDFIGLVDSERDNDFEAEYESRPRMRNSGRAANMEDQFEEEPRLARASGRTAEYPVKRPSPAMGNNRFGEEDAWGEAPAANRPEYSSRLPQKSTASRPSSYNKYTGGQRYGSGEASRVSSRYADASSGGTRSYYAAREHGASSRSSASDYSAYGTVAHRDALNDANYGSTADNRGVASSYQRHQTVIFRLHSVDECKDVILSLIEKKSILLNLDELDSMQAQRALDTMSGATFAIGATLSRASDRTWLIAPNNVDVADLQTDNGYGNSRYM